MAKKVNSDAKSLDFRKRVYVRSFFSWSCRSAFYYFLCLGEREPCAYFVPVATAPLQFAFSFGIIQAVMAVAIFFFMSVGDPKHLLSQTQKFNNVFLWKTKKGRFSERKTLWKPPWNSVPPVRFRAVGRNRRLASFYLCLKSNFEKVRKTAKNEENPRKSRVFRPASFKTGTLGGTTRNRTGE